MSVAGCISLSHLTTDSISIVLWRTCHILGINSKSGYYSAVLTLWQYTSWYRLPCQLVCRSKARRSVNTPTVKLKLTMQWIGGVIDKTKTVRGQDSLFCAWSCYTWLHRRHVSLSVEAFLSLCKSDKPYLCPHLECQATTENLWAKNLIWNCRFKISHFWIE